MPADKMVSYPMQNNGSLDEEAFFFGTRFRTLRCAPRALPFGNPQTFVYEKSVETRFQLQKTSVLRRRRTDFVLSQKVQRASVLTRTIAVCWNYYFVQNQSAKQRAGSACPKKHSMALCFFGVVNL